MIFPKGTILYHGTSTDVNFRKLKAPAWFTTSHQLASIFAADMGGNKGDSPRVLVYKTVKKLDLPEVTQRDAMLLEEQMSRTFKGRYTNAAKEYCKNNAGWVIPAQYDKYGSEEGNIDEPTLDDIMICDLSTVEYVKTTPIDIEHYLDTKYLTSIKPTLLWVRTLDDLRSDAAKIEAMRRLVDLVVSYTD